MNVVAPNPKSKSKVPLQSAEERTNALERRRELGQFFTPANVARFMWDFLEVIRGDAFPPHTRVIDPACGEGVFLHAAHERAHLHAGCLFGADIDETLASGWRRDTLLSNAQVQLGNGLVDEPTLGIREGTFDIVAGNPPFSGKGLRELLRLLEDDGEPERHEEQDLFGVTCLKEEPAVARQPLLRQERSEFDALVRSLSRYACWRLNATSEDDEGALTSKEESSDLFGGMLLHDMPRPTVSDLERAANLISKWPADRLLDVSRPEIRDVILRLASTAIEVFFTERFLRLAKPGGLIAVIVPESIVASARLSPLRRWLAERMDLLASVGLPQKVFSGVGANAKTTILFLRRSLQEWGDAAKSSKASIGQPEVDRLVLLTAPLLDSADWSLETYLDSVLHSARENQNVYWAKPK